MKILIISQYYYPEPFSITSVAEELVKCGHEVCVLTGKPNYGYYKVIPGYESINHEILNGVEIFRVNVIPRQDSKTSVIRNYLSYYRNAKRHVKKLDKDFDVVFSMSLSPVISIVPAIKYAKKHRIKHVLHCVDVWPESVVATNMVRKNSLAYKILWRWSKAIYKKTDRILVSSASFVDYFRNVLALDTKKCVYVPQAAIEVKTNDPIEFDSSYTNIVYCGNIGKLQMMNLVIDAVKIIKDITKIKFHVIGIGSETEDFCAKIKQNNLEENIIYVGAKSTEEATRFFKNADALYVGLKSGTFTGSTIPNKLILYLRYGRPILGVISGDGRQILESAHGAVIAEENAESLAENINAIAKMSPELKDELGNNNRKYYENHFTIKNIVKIIEEELRN